MAYNSNINTYPYCGSDVKEERIRGLECSVAELYNIKANKNSPILIAPVTVVDKEFNSNTLYSIDSCGNQRMTGKRYFAESIEEQETVEDAIQNLYDVKATCINGTFCNSNGNITLQSRENGDEYISGKHLLAEPICGYSDIETPLEEILSSGSGGLATKILTEDLTSLSSYKVAVIDGESGSYNDVKTVPGFTACIVYDGPTICDTIIQTGTICAKTAIYTDCIGFNSSSLCIDGDIETPGNISTCNISATGSVSNSCFTIDSNGNACFASVCTNNLKEVNDICSSTNIINFKDKCGCQLGCINGTAINFNTGNFTNLNTTNLNTTNFNVETIHSNSISNDYGCIGGDADSLIIGACGTRNIIIQNGCGYQLTLDDNCIKYGSIFNVDRCNDNIAIGHYACATGGTTAIGTNACSYVCGGSSIDTKVCVNDIGGIIRIQAECDALLCDVFKVLDSTVRRNMTASGNWSFGAGTSVTGQFGTAGVTGISQFSGLGQLTYYTIDFSSSIINGTTFPAGSFTIPNSDCDSTSKLGYNLNVVAVRGVGINITGI